MHAITGEVVAVTLALVVGVVACMIALSTAVLLLVRRRRAKSIKKADQLKASTCGDDAEGVEAHGMEVEGVEAHGMEAEGVEAHGVEVEGVELRDRTSWRRWVHQWCCSSCRRRVRCFCLSLCCFIVLLLLTGGIGVAVVLFKNNKPYEYVPYVPPKVLLAPDSPPPSAPRPPQLPPPQSPPYIPVGWPTHPPPPPFPPPYPSQPPLPNLPKTITAASFNGRWLTTGTEGDAEALAYCVGLDFIEVSALKLVDFAWKGEETFFEVSVDKKMMRVMGKSPFVVGETIKVMDVFDDFSSAEKSSSADDDDPWFFWWEGAVFHGQSSALPYQRSRRFLVSHDIMVFEKTCQTDSGTETTAARWMKRHPEAE